LFLTPASLLLFPLVQTNQREINKFSVCINDFQSTRIIYSEFPDRA
jgi:hypothetical protein